MLNRIIDLSAAAAKLGMTTKGTAMVEVKTITTLETPSLRRPHHRNKPHLNHTNCIYK